MRLFHQTSKENIEDIMKFGLIPNRAGIVYLSPRSDLGFGDVTIEVETDDNKLTAFDDCKEWEVLCWGKIPPDRIRLDWSQCKNLSFREMNKIRAKSANTIREIRKKVNEKTQETVCKIRVGN